MSDLKEIVVQLANDLHKANLENQRLRGIIAQHELCHDLHGKVDALDFAKGCEAEQRRIYGCAPHADEVERLRELLGEIHDTAETGASEDHPCEPWLPAGLFLKMNAALGR